MPVLTGLNPDVQPSMGGIQLLAPGPHTVKVVNTEVQATHDNTGQQVVVHFQALTGETPRHWFTFTGGAEPWHKEKGQEQLALLCECIGVPFTDLGVKGTEIMHGRDVVVVIKHRESKQLKDDGTPFMNMEITNFLPAKSVAPSEAAQPKADAPW